MLRSSPNTAEYSILHGVPVTEWQRKAKTISPCVRKWVGLSITWAQNLFLTLSAWNYDARVESPAAAASPDRQETLFCAATAATAQRFPRSPCSFSPPLCAAAQNGRSKHGSRSSGGGGSLRAPRPSFWRAKTDRLHRIAESKLVPNYCSGALFVANWLINERLLHSCIPTAFVSFILRFE